MMVSLVKRNFQTFGLFIFFNLKNYLYINRKNQHFKTSNYINLITMKFRFMILVIKKVKISYNKVL